LTHTGIFYYEQWKNLDISDLLIFLWYPQVYSTYTALRE